MKMNQLTRRSAIPSTFFLAALLALSACSSNESAPEKTDGTSSSSASATQAQITESYSAQAEVTAINKDARLITLRREDGRLFEVKATSDVRNFDQIAVGDHLKVQYKATVIASLRPAGEPARSAEGMAAVGRAPAGAKPAGGAGIAMAVRVKIESVDKAHDLVVFSLASGELVTHRVATPEGRKFLAGIKPGDTVQVSYAEAVALSVEKL